MLDEARRIAVFRALQLGDLLCAVPALRSLRAATPRAEITLIGLPWAESFANRFGRLIDRFIAFPGHPGLPETRPQIHRYPRFLTEVQKRRFDLAVQLHGSGEITNLLVSQFGAQRTAGYYLPGRYCPDPTTYIPYPEGGTEVARNLDLVEFLGGVGADQRLEFPVGRLEYRRFEGLIRASGLSPREYICIHPGARSPDRRWPLAGFASVGGVLADRGWQVVITGSADEQQLASTLAAMLPQRALNLAGKTGLGELAALLENCRLLVCNDTGVSHLAAAVGIPSVVVYTGSDPSRWGPPDRTRHRLVVGTEPLPMTVSAVLREVSQLLGEEALHA